MSRIDQIETEKERKLDEIRKMGINPFPYSFDRDKTVSELLAYGNSNGYEKDVADYKNKKITIEKLREIEQTKLPKNSFSTCGRLKAFRNMGKINFSDL